MKHRDLWVGAGFFVAMAAFGALVLALNRSKWRAETEREERRFRVFEADRRAAAGRQRLAQARAEPEAERRRAYAQEAADHFAFAIEVNPGLPDLYAARAEAHDLAGDEAAAARDRARAAALDGSR